MPNPSTPKPLGIRSTRPCFFLHGDPGYNYASFEISTAPLLAEQGYYVIAYDRRGEGRSTGPNAEFS